MQIKTSALPAFTLLAAQRKQGKGGQGGGFYLHVNSLLRQ